MQAVEPDPEYDEDSEYDPTKDENHGLESGDDSDNNNSKKKGPLTVFDIANEAKRKRIVDNAWADMISNDTNEISKKKASLIYANNNDNKQTTNNPKKKKRKLSKDISDMMTTIFGSKKAKKLEINDNNDRDNIKSDEIKKNLKDIVKKIQKKEIVQETRKFAGKEIAIERTVKVGESSSSSSSSSSSYTTAPATALDKALDVLKGPKVVSTVAKSSYDWENFKEKEGIEDDLAVATKEGYLTRKDFLERCDHRAFEKEKEERLRNMTANSNQ